MEENITEDIAKKETILTDKKNQRSSPYPSLTVFKAYDFALKINEQFSTIAEVSREEIAFAFKVNSGSIIRDISSCVQYNLLDKNTSEGKYRLSKLFSEIFRPESDKDKKLAYIKAFGSPKIYNELITKFDNNIIPNELTNTLIKNHNIREEVAKNAADIFIESGKEVGVINDNRVLKYSITISTLEKTQYAIIEDIDSHDTELFSNLLPALSSNKIDKKNINIPIHLTGNKVAIFAYPNDITENDIKIVEHQLAGVLLRIKLESGEQKEGAATPS